MSGIFSRDCFKEILRYLCADNSERHDRNASGYKLFKIQALIGILNLSFLSLYSPKQSLSIDESMVGTKCMDSFIQYTPKKTKLELDIIRSCNRVFSAVSGVHW